MKHGSVISSKSPSEDQRNSKNTRRRNPGKANRCSWINRRLKCFHWFSGTNKHTTTMIWFIRVLIIIIFIIMKYINNAMLIGKANTMKYVTSSHRRIYLWSKIMLLNVIFSHAFRWSSVYYTEPWFTEKLRKLLSLSRTISSISDYIICDLACQRTTALCSKRCSIWKHVMEIYC